MLANCIYCPAIATKQCTCSIDLFCSYHCADHIQNMRIARDHTITDAKIKLDYDTKELFKHSILSRLEILEQCKTNILYHASSLQTKIEILCRNSIKRLEIMSKHFSTFLNVEKYSIKQIEEIEQILETTFKTDFNPDYAKINKIEEYFSQNFYEESSIWNKFLKIHTGKIKSVAVTKDEQTLITCGDDFSIKFFSLTSKTVSHILEGHTREINCIALSKNNEYLVSGSSDQTVRLWDAIQLTQICVFKGHKNSVLCVAISDDSTFIASGSADGSICVWNLADKRLNLTISDSGIALSIIFLQESLLFCSSEGKAIEWNLTKRARSSELFVQNYEARCIALSFDSKKIVSGGVKGKIFYWVNKIMIGYIGSHTSTVNAICFANKDENIISASEDHTVQVSCLRNSSVIITFKDHNESVNCLAPIRDDLFVSGSDDYTMRIWDTSTLTMESVIELKKISMSQIAIYSKSIAFVMDRMITIYNLIARKVESQINLDSWTVYSMALNTCYLAFGGRECQIKLYDRYKKILISLQPIEYKPISALALSSNLLVSGSHDYTIKVWNLGNKNAMAKYLAHNDIILSVAISNNSRLIATGSKDLTAKLWNVKQVQVIFIFYGHICPVEKVMFSLDNKFVFTASSEGYIRVWDSSNGREYYIITSLEQAKEMLGYTLEMQKFAQRFLF
jgi:WD40 repeat protein